MVMIFCEYKVLSALYSVHSSVFARIINCFLLVGVYVGPIEKDHILRRSRVMVLTVSETNNVITLHRVAVYRKGAYILNVVHNIVPKLHTQEINRG